MTSVFVPGGVFSVAVSFNVVSAPLTAILSSVVSIPVGNPSSIRFTSLVNPARRANFTVVSVWRAADWEFVGNAVTFNRDNVLDTTNGTSVTVTGTGRLYWTTDCPATVASPL